METAISNIESPNLNLRSPYENLLPPIELTDRELREQPQASKRDKLASLRKPQPKPVHDRDKFPSYLEREAMRKEAAIKKRNQNIVVRCVC